MEPDKYPGQNVVRTEKAETGLIPGTNKIVILIADSHVSDAKGNVSEFFEMLGAVARSSHDVVFLGDILDLWIALPPFEQDLNRRLLAWCHEEKLRRLIGFVEGNHEFFLHRHQAEAFTFSAPLNYTDPTGRVFTHGDLINRRDYSYRLFRAVVRNRVTECLLAHLPGTPRLAAAIKRKMNARTAKQPKILPEDELRTFAEDQFARGATHIYCGHFHQSFDYEDGEGRELHVVPQWQGTGLVGIIDDRDGFAIRHWQAL